MKIKINVGKIHGIVLVLMTTLVISLVFITAQSLNKPNPGHDSDEVNVNLNGEVITLQKAIDDGLLGGVNNSIDFKFVSGVLDINAPFGGDAPSTTKQIITTEDPIYFLHAGFCQDEGGQDWSNVQIWTQGGFDIRPANLARVRTEQHYDGTKNQISLLVNGDNQAVPVKVCWFAITGDRALTEEEVIEENLWRYNNRPTNFGSSGGNNEQ